MCIWERNSRNERYFKNKKENKSEVGKKDKIELKNKAKEELGKKNCLGRGGVHREKKKVTESER